MVVVPGVVVSAVPGSVVAGGGVVSSVEVGCVVWPGIGVVAEVVVRRADDDVEVVDVVATSAPDGLLECRDVCTTANVSNATTRKTAPPAAITAPRRSYHSTAAG
jgi:hypothetical protein